ncbi:MAG: hypothetical protein GTO17_04460 [Candidatus Aminicenantes bacterium]|nr:hypothetical protein [Candidatus Aminicenantes bacterium]
MANFKFLGMRGRILSICVASGLVIPLLLLAQSNQGKGGKGKDPNCNTVTADAEFRDAIGDGIYSDGYGFYKGLEGATVCLLTEQDHDFILGCMNTKIEKGYIDRKVTLDFLANNTNLPPFDPIQVVDVSIRVDEVLSETNYTDQEKRFLLWFDIGRNSYQLRFDGLDECEWVKVTQYTDPDTGLRQWTIESIGTHTARLEKVKGKRFTVGHFIMPFQITVYETDKDPTCF